MARTVVIDQDECISCGACVDSCPDVFRLNDDNIAEVYNQDGASEEEIDDAIESCPVSCIRWED